MGDLERTNAELRAAVIIAGKRIVKLNFAGVTIRSCRFCAACCANPGRTPGRIA
jgi:hypothetical protein